MVRITDNFSLQSLNTFAVDTVAAHYSVIRQKEDLLSLAAFPAFSKGLLFLGGGSNFLFTRPVEEWVLHNKILGIEKIDETVDAVVMKVGAGENWSAFVAYCVQQGYGGLENLSLIPGSVGAAPIQNIGAYGVEVKDAILSVDVWDASSNTFRVFDRLECAFGYRDSIFKRLYSQQLFITSVTFSLLKYPELHLNYGTIRQELELMGVADPGIADVAGAVIRIRQSKLPDPAVIGNAGSFFKNPEMAAADFRSLQSAWPSVPFFELPDQRIKIPAAWLIEQCGWKGYRQANYGVHPRQALVLVNYGGAEGNAIATLSEDIQQSVLEKFGIALEKEVRIY